MTHLLDFLLDRSKLAVAYFTAENKLVYYSPKAAALWNLDEDYLKDALPKVEEFFEVVREGGKYPEKDDFDLFCSSLQNYYSHSHTNRLVTHEGLIIEESFVPFEGGLLVIWQDTSTLWREKNLRRTYEQLYYILVSKLPLPTIVVDSDGSLVNINWHFRNYFKLSESYLPEGSRAEQLLKKLEPLTKKTTSNTLPMLLGLLLHRGEFTFTLPLENGVNIEISNVNLPNGNNLIIFRNSENITPNLNFSQIKTSLKELQQNLLLELNKICAAPLSNIVGFTELLKNGSMGKVNRQQLTILQSLSNQAQNVIDSLNYRLDLDLYEDGTEESPTKGVANQQSLSSTVEISEVDTSEVLVSVMKEIEPLLKAKQIQLKLDLESLSAVKSNYKSLVRLLTLTFKYLIKQVNNSAEMRLKLSFNPFKVEFEDSSKEALFSPLEMNSNLELILLLKTLESLKGHYITSFKNRSLRSLVFTFCS